MTPAAFARLGEHYQLRYDHHDRALCTNGRRPESVLRLDNEGIARDADGRPLSGGAAEIGDYLDCWTADDGADTVSRYRSWLMRTGRLACEFAADTLPAASWDRPSGRMELTLSRREDGWWTMACSIAAGRHELVQDWSAPQGATVVVAIDNAMTFVALASQARWIADRDAEEATSTLTGACTAWRRFLGWEPIG